MYGTNSDGQGRRRMFDGDSCEYFKHPITEITYKVFDLGAYLECKGSKAEAGLTPCFGGGALRQGLNLVWGLLPDIMRGLLSDAWKGRYSNPARAMCIRYFPANIPFCLIRSEGNPVIC